MAHPHSLLPWTIIVLAILLNIDNGNAAIANFGFEKPVMDLSDLEEMDKRVNFKAASAQHRFLQSVFCCHCLVCLFVTNTTY